MGDFAFSHESYGSGFDAHMCVGTDKLILFNNTEKSTGEITSNSTSFSRSGLTALPDKQKAPRKTGRFY